MEKDKFILPAKKGVSLIQDETKITSVTVAFDKILIDGFLNSMSWEVKIPKVTPKVVTNVAASVPAVNPGSLFKFILRYLSGKSS